MPAESPTVPVPLPAGLAFKISMSDSLQKNKLGIYFCLYIFVIFPFMKKNNFHSLGFLHCFCRAMAASQATSLYLNTIQLKKPNSKFSKKIINKTRKSLRILIFLYHMEIRKGLKMCQNKRKNNLAHYPITFQIITEFVSFE